MISVLLPAPGGPAMPILCPWPGPVSAKWRSASPTEASSNAVSSRERARRSGRDIIRPIPRPRREARCARPAAAGGDTPAPSRPSRIGLPTRRSVSRSIGISITICPATRRAGFRARRTGSGSRRSPGPWGASRSTPVARIRSQTPGRSPRVTKRAVRGPALPWSRTARPSARRLRRDPRRRSRQNLSCVMNRHVAGPRGKDLGRHGYRGARRP